jgi:hypothetical protein
MKINFPKTKLLYLLVYMAVSALVYVIFISSIAFFHFLIDHSMMDIEAWVFDKNWSIFLFIKLIAFYFIHLFLSVKLPSGENVLTLFQKNTVLPLNSIFVGVLTLLLMTLFVIKPEIAEFRIFHLSKVLVSFSCSFLLFSLDSFLVLFVEKSVAGKGESKFKMILIYTLFISLLNFISFGASSVFLPFIVMIHFFNFYLVLFYNSFRSVMLMNFFLTSPLISVIGLDPVWGSTYSVLEPGMRLSWLNVTILVAVVTAYWQWCRRSENTQNTIMV